MRNRDPNPSKLTQRKKRKRPEEALRASEERYALAERGGDSGIFRRQCISLPLCSALLP